MDDQYETRPTKLTVTLQKSTDGETWTDTGITAELNNGNGWAAIQENLPLRNLSYDALRTRLRANGALC